MAFVLDASVALAWVLPDEDSPKAAALLPRLVEEGAVVPQLWPLEIANVLLVASRRGRLTLVDTQRVAADLHALPIEVDQETHRRAFGAVLELATRHGLSVYDAAYLELAQRRRLPLATFDARLRAACEAAGIAII
jgi:predicted nucleic acid-binding protein